ncbi:hypothetical protein GOP47_0001402, partial [Adiantum capillus-veneris]
QLSAANVLNREQPLAGISLQQATVNIDPSASISASPTLLGLQGNHAELVTVIFNRSAAASSDWIAVFSPAKFNASLCVESDDLEDAPFFCNAPIKYQFANFTSADYEISGRGMLHLRLINQRADFSFAYFSGGITSPVLLAISEPIRFWNPKAPLYPRLALGRSWNEMVVTWTSGYGIHEAIPIVRWGTEEFKIENHVSAGTLTYERHDMCGPPALTVGWRDPGFTHSSYLSDLWPNVKYYYKVGHKLVNGTYDWSKEQTFKGPPYPGQSSLQRIIVFGDLGKAERDLSNEYSNYQPGSLNTTDRLIEDLANIDAIFHIGDLSYANGYLSQWDQFTELVEPLSSQVPYMVASGNHERDWPNSGSFYKTKDSGGECGAVTETMFYVPSKNRAKFWYSADYGLFHFCIADSEHDWRPGTEQYRFIEECLSGADRRKQPWLIFIAHRVLGYSSSPGYASEGTFAEPFGRDSLQQLWQKYKVDLAFYGHVHNYERTCPVYEGECVSEEKNFFSGRFNATIHLVVGGGGSHLVNFSSPRPDWSVFQDKDFGFVKLTAYNSSGLLLEYKKSSDGKVYDQLWISRRYKDILGCDSLNNCPETTWAT